MTSFHDLFHRWSEDPYFDPATRAELAAVAADPAAIEDRFWQPLSFGTGGLRGLIGAGTNRVNRYTIRHATAGLAQYITAFEAELAGREADLAQNSSTETDTTQSSSTEPHTCGDSGLKPHIRGVVIAHDSRRCSPEFAKEAALTLNAFGIRAYLWESLRPTPMLSFAVRELRAIAGVVVTASHNPKEYNGYKVYWEDGGQVPPERATAIQAAMAAITDITAIQPMGEEAARASCLLLDVPPAVDRAYMDQLMGLIQTAPKERQSCKILYSPLHGAGARPVQQALTEAGFAVSIVPEQWEPDAEFPTVHAPNPEESEVFTLALAQAQTEQPDVILATDPDADRLGVMAREQSGEYRLLSGNQIGAILADYRLTSLHEAGLLPENGAIIKTIATSNLIAPLCKQYGVTLIDTHTGFKFIGDLIREFEQTGAHTFLLGYEESYGYLGATFVRDKDAVMAALMVAEATAHHKARGRTLYAALERIWERCGYFAEDLHNVTLPGKAGQVQIAALMERLRQSPPRTFDSVTVACADDYAAGTGVDYRTGTHYPLALAKANVLHYRFADGGFVMVRPSGTEPKLKLYVSVSAPDPAAATVLLAQVKAAALQQMGLA